MPDYGITAGDTNVTIYVRLRDSTTGLGKTGLAWDDANAVCSYVLPAAARAAIALATQTVTGAHSDGGFVEVDGTNCKGLYRLDLSDAAVASGAYTLISIEFDGTIEETVLIPLGIPDVNVVKWLGSVVVNPTAAGVPVVDVTHVGGATTNVAALATNADAIKTKTDYLPSATAGAAGGVFIAGTNAATTITTALTTTFTGNLTGSVGSVTGAVGSVTGAVGSVTAGVTLANGAITDASLAGNMEIVFETDFATNYNTTRNAWATNAQDFVGTTAADPFNGQVVAASVTGAVGSVTAGVTLANGAITDASLAGNMEIVFETDFATNYNATRNAWVTNAQDFVGTTAADPFNGQVVAASVTGAVGSVTAGVTLAAGAVTDASLAGNMEIVFETDFATNYNTTRNAWATNAQDFVGTTAADPFNGQVVAASVTGAVGSVTGAVGSVTGNVGGNVAGSVASVTAGVTLANGAITDASLAGNMEIVFETDFATNYNTTRNAWATNAQDFVGTTAADPFNGQIVSASVTGAVGSVTGAVGSVTGNVGGNVTGSVGALTTAAITDVWATDTLTEAYATDGSAATPAQLLYMLWSALSEFAISSTTITSKKLDGSTTAMTFTLDDDTSPTSRTRAS